MRYTDDLIEEVRTRNDIVDIIGESVHLVRSGNSYKGLCPFHNEKTPSFHVNRDKQVYYCFGCHAGGTVFTFLREYSNMSFGEAMEYLADRAGISLPKEEYTKEQKEKSDKKTRLLAASKKAAGYFHYILKTGEGERGLAYLRKRGLADETIRKFGLGYSGRGGDSLYRYLKSKGFDDPLLAESGLFRVDEKNGFSDLFWNRVMFPIPDARGRVIAFGGRVMGDGKPKYLNSPETFIFNKRRNLFGLNLARSTRRPYLILCEGYMDVISLHSAGFDCAVASLGTALTEQQASLMRRFKEDVLLIYDSDSAGRAATLRAIPILEAAGIAARVVNLKPYKDPDEFLQAMGPEAMEERLNRARDAFLFTVDENEKQFDGSDPRTKTRFQHRTAELLAAVPDELLRNNYLETVAREKGIPLEALRKLVNRSLMNGTPAESIRPVKSGRPRNAGESGQQKTEKLMLSYLASYFPEAYEETRNMISPEDFTDELLKKVAEGLYAQMAKGKISEAALIGISDDLEVQSRIAGIFHSRIPVANGAELDRAFTDTAARMLEAGQARAEPLDREGIQRMLERKKLLDRFRSGKEVLHLPWKETEE
ncbi:MAG: DNA primase [Lachnospiraceae bacterium]|nr:DNA primase [Lachnospiraceae bacterium]